MRIQTEIGLLPEDWKVRTLGEVAPLQRGFDLPSSELRKGPYPVVYSNGILNYHNIGPCIAPGLVTGRSGTIGKFTYIPEGRYWPHNTALWVTSFKDNCPLFIRYLFETVNFGAYSTGTGVPTLNRNDLHTCAIPLPPKPEQERIAAALTSIDSLIDNLERTIQKKKNIREGAMEELLSGKRRLPGFSGEWVEKSLDDLVKVKKGQQKNASELLDKGPYPVINGGQTASGYTTEYNTEGDIVTISEGGNSCGFVNYIRQRFWSGGHCYALYVKDKNLDNTFLYFMLKAGEKEIMSLRVGSGLPNIQTKQLLEFVFFLPSDIREQHAIADTLTALDDEVALLQAERDKYLQIRSGMMDDLLTGKIRLQ